MKRAVKATEKKNPIGGSPIMSAMMNGDFMCLLRLVAFRSDTAGERQS